MRSAASGEHRKHGIAPVPGTSVCGVANHAGSDPGASGDHFNSDDSAAGASGPEEVTSVSEKQRRLLFTVPILLGLFICILDLLVLIRIWRSVYFSNFVYLSRATLPNTFFLALMTISFAIGLALIGYAIALRHYEEWYDEKTEIQQESQRTSVSTYEPSRVHPYLKWLVGPILVAMPAPALAVWAAATIEPISPRPCIDVLQQALNIKRENPNFKLIWNDRDELRCSVNQVLDE